MGYKKSVADLYRRLAERGLDRHFVQRAATPAGWQDEYARQADGRARLERWLAAVIGVEPALLADPGAPLPEAIDGRAWVADRVAELAVRALARERAPWLDGLTGDALRASVVENHRVVRLRSVAQSMWSLGVPILPLRVLPTGPATARLGATRAGSTARPVVLVGDRHDAPAWMLWEVAEALGGAEFATSLLNPDGIEPLEGRARITGVKLAAMARTRARDLAEDAGVVVVRYARMNDAAGPARRALKLLGVESGGAAMLASIAERALDLSRLRAPEARFLKVVLNIVAL